VCPPWRSSLETGPIWLTFFPWRRQELVVQAENEASAVKYCSSSAFNREKERSHQLLVSCYPMATHSLHWATAAATHLSQTSPREAAAKCFGAVRGKTSRVIFVASVGALGTATVNLVEVLLLKLLTCFYDISVSSTHRLPYPRVTSDTDI